MAVVVVFLQAAAALGSAPAASAATFPWYWSAANNEDCWQAGRLGEPGTACDYVFTNFLSYRTQEINVELHGVPPDGDYCNPYEVGKQPESPIEANAGPVTGFTPPGTPYSSYQEGDAYGDVCQASASHWGQEVQDRAPENHCASDCGMNHFVSLIPEGGQPARLPWGSEFGSPSLVLGGEAHVQTVAHDNASGYGAWGYLCAWLKETGEAKAHIEYCFDEWQDQDNGAAWDAERVGECTPKGVQILTSFNPGTSFATEVPGSSNTLTVNGPGAGYFEAKITEGDLLNAIRLANAELVLQTRENAKGELEPWPGHPILGKGCKLGLPAEPADYELIGLEQGMEGWIGMTTLGGFTGGLEAHTEYTPLPPEVSTGGATAISEEDATLAGTVNARRTDTHFWFEYGETTGYGKVAAPSNNGVAAAEGSQPVEAVVSGLRPNSTYHYRLVAASEGGTVHGADRTFATAAPMIAFQANTGELFTYSATGGIKDTTEGMSPGTSPGIAALGAGAYAMAFTANTGELFTFTSAGGASDTTEGVATSTSPSIARLATGSYVVAFQANTNELFLYSPTFGVVDTHEGMAPGTSPSIAAYPDGGYVVAFQANTGELFLDSSAFGVRNTTEGMWPGTDPSVVTTPDGNYIVAFSANTDELYILSQADGVFNSTDGLQRGTSPSLAASGVEGYVAAFTANTGELFTLSSFGGTADTTEGVWPGSSPSVRSLGGDGYEIAFNANTGELFTESTQLGVVNTTEGLARATMPSIAG